MAFERAGAAADLWVFAYGSLIWNPGFPYLSREPARLEGYCRAYCVLSYHYRGRPEAPGLVLGLKVGGACEGVVYRVEAAHAEETLAYLRARELVTSVYHERIVPIATRSGVQLEAVAYIADPAHEQYVDDHDFDALVATIAAAHGLSGPNIEYALNTAAHLAEFGIDDPEITRVAEALRLTERPFP